MNDIAEIHLRDPYILPIADEEKYYLFGTATPVTDQVPLRGFDYFTSDNLDEWQGPFPAFRAPASFWADRDFTSPEVHVYADGYYMFASFKAPGRCRGTQILAASFPGGPYLPHSHETVTPHNWECRDGTFFVDRSGDPWVIFCREWMEVGNGEICATPLEKDLSAAAGNPALLFRALDAPWVRVRDRHAVAEGPFLHRTDEGQLIMLWSSYDAGGYAIGIARSEKGLLGPWHHDPDPLYVLGGGHGMLFRMFEGLLMLTLHHPNSHPHERPIFIPIRERAGQLILQK